MRVHCCNPTCAAVLRNSAGDPIELVVVYPELLEGFGWGIRYDLDGKPEAICGRCIDDE